MQYQGSGRQAQERTAARWTQWRNANASSEDGQRMIVFVDRLAQLLESRMGSGAQVRQIAEEMVSRARREYPLVSTREVVAAIDVLAQYWRYGDNLRAWCRRGGSLGVSYELRYRGSDDAEQVANAISWTAYSSTNERAYALSVRVAAAVEAELARGGGREADFATRILRQAIEAVQRDLSSPRGRYVKLQDSDVRLARTMLRDHWVHGAAWESRLLAARV